MIYDYLSRIVVMTGATETDLVFAVMLACFALACRPQFGIMGHFSGLMTLLFFGLSVWIMSPWFSLGIPVVLLIFWSLFKALVNTYFSTLRVFEMPFWIGGPAFLMGLVCAWYWLKIGFNVDLFAMTVGLIEKL